MPQSLTELVSMMEHNWDIETETTQPSNISTFTIQFSPESKEERHFVAGKHVLCVVKHHLPLLFAKTRKRQLIDILHQYDICISYDRVLEISSQMGEALVER